MAVISAVFQKSLWAKTRGLLGAKEAYPIFFKTRWGIHTFCLNFPIDVLIFDSYNKVVKMTHNLRPYRVFLWPPKYENVLELPEGEIAKHGIHHGDTIEVQCINLPHKMSESEGS